MLAVEKSRYLTYQIKGIIRRVQHIKYVKTQQYEFFRELQELYSSFSQRLHKDMVAFEETLLRHSLYAAPKTAYILNFAKIYRNFSIQLYKSAKLNLLALSNVPSGDISEQEGKLQRKCYLFLKEFYAYLSSYKSYNLNYTLYNDKCVKLDSTIKMYRSYQDPVSFYNQARANEYISELDRLYNDCSGLETTVVNDIQGLDQTRKWMGDHCKYINYYYVILLHLYLRTVHATINAIVDPHTPSTKYHKESTEYGKDYQLSMSQAQLPQSDDVNQEYSELFSQTYLQIDYRFFHERCYGIRGKRLKTSEEIVRVQRLLVSELYRQTSSSALLEKEYRAIYRDIFTNNGIDSFKKRFRKYFGANFLYAQELCFALLDRLKRSLDRIAKSTEDCKDKLKRLCDSKQEAIGLFDRRTKALLDEHLKLKEKMLGKATSEGYQLRKFRESVGQCLVEVRKCFLYLYKSETYIYRLFFNTLKAHCDTIIKEAVNRNRNRVLEKENGRVSILQKMDSEDEVLLILKEDTRYYMLMNECPKPTLYANFQSLSKKKEYYYTKRLLQMKESRLNGMVRTVQGCCGTSTYFIKQNVQSQHPCKLLTNNQKIKGVIHVTNSGIIFYENTWFPFSEPLRVMVPQSDIQAFDSKAIENRYAVYVGTDFGNLLFQSNVCTYIVYSMQKNISFKPGRYGSEKGKRSDSSSFLKNNTSTEFKLTYDKSLNHASTSDLSRPPIKPVQSKTQDTLKDFLRRWKYSNFLSDRFTIIILKEGEKYKEGRRDYQYSSGASRFVLKEKREAAIYGKYVVLRYDWKVCFPHSPMLRSFKHNQKVHIEGLSKELRVRIVTAPLVEEHLFLRNKFYRYIEEMNDRLAKFIVNTLQKEADVLIQPEDAEKSVDSNDIIVFETNEERPHELTQRHSRLKSGMSIDQKQP